MLIKFQIFGNLMKKQAEEHSNGANKKLSLMKKVLTWKQKENQKALLKCKKKVRLEEVYIPMKLV